MKTRLISGQTFSLSDLFCAERRIIIPDLQRDYCWGNKLQGESKLELVSGFIESLFDSYQNDCKSDLQMGMIYAYENPINHIQLCDGQQRITTLYLLMGLLYKKTKNVLIKRCLISDFELNEDDKEPYLQYAIRESTLYFLSDLVCDFFLKDDINVDQIKKTSWYFSEYDLDPTIQSILSSLAIMEIQLNENSHLELTKFSNFLINNIKFFYFDMINRQHGEEMFVVINTTGEPLTATENVKPILIGNIENFEERQLSSNLWEKWEKWFWQKKLENEHEADNGLNDFLIWYWQIKLKQENDWSSGRQEKLSPLKLFKEKPTRKIESEESEYSTISQTEWEKAKSIKEVDLYFTQFQILNDYFTKESFKNVFSSINKDALKPRKFNQIQVLQIILPTLEFMVKFPEQVEMHLQFIRRLRKNYFDNLWSERKNNYVDWRHLLEIIGKSDTSDDVLMYQGSLDEFKKIANVNCNIENWFNKEEKLKNKLKVKNKEEIERWEDHVDFMGDLSPIFEVSEWSFNFNDLNKSFNTYTKIRIKDYHFSKNINLENLYRLYCLLMNRQFEHRGVGGHGYCMMVEFDGKSYLQKEFNEIWQFFLKEEDELLLTSFFTEKLKCFFEKEIFSISDIEEKLKNTNNIEPYKKIMLWAYLEYLFNKNMKINFSKSIACFWGYPNLINIEEEKLSEKNDYQVSNLILGTSYPNNKSGWVQYELPLMKKLDKEKVSKELLDSTTKNYIKQLQEFLS